MWICLHVKTDNLEREIEAQTTEIMFDEPTISTTRVILFKSSIFSPEFS